MIITKELAKAARALVGITVNDFERKSGFNSDTLRSFESGRTKTLSAINQEALVKAFIELGVEFIPENGGGAGVRTRDRSS